MEKRIKIKKKKREKSWLTKTLNRIVLPAYLAFLALSLGVTGALWEAGVNAEILTYVLLALVLLSSFSVLFSIPFFRAAQAKRDLKNYDFTPHDAQNEEVFEFSRKVAKYYFTPSPFEDDEGETQLNGSSAAENYFGQFAPERLIRVEQLDKAEEIIPFYTFDFTLTHAAFLAEKRKENDGISVTLTEKYELTFAEDGLHVYGEVIPYAEIEGFVSAKFIQRETRADVRLHLLIGGVAIASFAFGTRIMSIVKKYGIKITNTELAEFILRDPVRAFRIVGLKKNLDKLKKSKLQQIKNHI